MSEIIAALREEHRNMAQLLKALERQLAVFDAAGRPDYDIMQGILEYCGDYPDRCHHPKEDLVFASLASRDPARAKAVGDLQAEHRELADLTRRFAEVVGRVLQEAEMSRDWVDGIARQFLDRYWAHMRYEEETIFPAALAVLSADDWRQIEAEAGEVGDPLFGADVAERYQALRDDIAAWERGRRQ